MLPDFYNLYELEDEIIISPNDRKQCIVIDRISQKFKFLDNADRIPLGVAPYTFQVLWGVLYLVSGYYLVVGDEIESVGELCGHQVFNITHSSVFRVAKSIRHMSHQQFYDERDYVSMLEKILATPGFYFCRSFDLTRPLQTQADGFQDDISLFSRCSQDYFWNGAMLRQLLAEFPSGSNTTLHDYCCPIIHGFVEIISNLPTHDSTTATYALISRRSTHRPGTRFFCRGVDYAGNAANFVETEQILLMKEHYFSFVQLRGSIPLFWTQTPCLKYTPSIDMPGIKCISDASDPRPEFIIDDTQKALCRRHFDQTVHMKGFGKNICINLVNQRGRERILERGFAQAVQVLDSNDVKYESFDFHHECGMTRWHRLKNLLERLEPEISRTQYFHCLVPANASFDDLLNSRSKSIRKKQQGVFRTNCVDCLDRTNVIQSMLGKQILHAWLQESALLANIDDSLDSIWPNFEFKFRNLWADHADYISIQYSGTPALKTDFTRLGKRTLQGKLNDGLNSLKRYYYNNFTDGFRQDSMNLLLGHFSTRCKDGNYRPIPASQGLSLGKKLLPPMFLITFSMLCFTVAFSKGPWTSKMNEFMIWGTTSAVSLFAIFLFGREYVNSPRLLITDGDDGSTTDGLSDSFRG